MPKPSRSKTSRKTVKQKRQDPASSSIELHMLDALVRAAWDEEGTDHIPASFRKRFAPRVMTPRGSDEDIENAYLVARFLVAPVVLGMPGTSDTLGQMAELVKKGGGPAPTLKSALAWFNWARSSWVTEGERFTVVHGLPHALAALDPRFLKLTEQTIRVQLSRRHRVARLAAELTVAVGAFGHSTVDASRKLYYRAIKLSVSD